MSVFYAILFMSVSFEVIYMLVYCWPFILSILYTQMYSLSYPVNTDQNIDDSSSTVFFVSNQILFNKWQCPSFWNHLQRTSK